MILKNIMNVIIVCISVSLISGSETNLLPNTLEYSLDLNIDFDAKKMYGKCEITIQNNATKPIEIVPVLLYRLLSVKKIENENNEPLTFIQNITNIIDWEKIQVNFIEIKLKKMLLPGEKSKLKLVYEGYLFGYAAEGWRYVKDHIDKNFTLIRTDGFGYPVIGYPTDAKMMIISQEHYDYRINITVPNGMSVVTAGKLTGETINNDKTTFNFRSKKPSWRLDIAISDYQTYEKGENKVYYFSADSLGARKIMYALQTCFDLYTRWFGPLDNYQGFSIIEVPEGYSSQQDIAAIILAAENFKPSNNMQTIYHEIAHSWNVTNVEVEPCRFESEGFAQFMQFLLSEKLDNKENAVSEAAQGYLDGIKYNFNEKKEYQSIPIKDYGIKNMTYYSYRLGMVVFAIFYNLVGQDQFNKIIGSFYRAHYLKGATMDEFIKHCIQSTPLDVKPFFDDWIYTTKGIQMVMEGKSYQDLIRYYKDN